MIAERTVLKSEPKVSTTEHQPLYASRVRVYPKAVDGPVRRIKWAVLVLCLVNYYVVPWIRWDRGPLHPNQAVLLDIANERFYFFNTELWPQDIYYLTGLLIMSAVSLFLVSSLFGRLWCGFSCPQTVWTDLFMFVERKIEGDRAERMRRDAGPRDGAYWGRKIAKHATWMAIAFWTGAAWIFYFVDAPTVVREFWTGQAALPVYFFMGLFTFTTYVLAGWAREQVCTYMCPWPRFQAAMLDEQSVIVTYQGFRGEPRSRHIKRTDESAKLGDCVDCNACVAVCPTGIDIRDGSQLECINCGLCVDACNPIMEKIGRPRNLIAFDTLADQVAKAEGRHEKFRLFRPRTIIYGAALAIAATVMATAFAFRPTLILSVEHDRAPLFVPLPDGSIRNGYSIRIANKTQTQTHFELSVDGLENAKMTVAENGAAASSHIVLPVEPDAVDTFRVLIAGDAPADGRRALTFSLKDPASGETVSRAGSFIGPSGAGATP